MDDLDAVLLDTLPLARIEVHALAQRQQRHVARVGSSYEDRLAQAPIAMADHRDAPAACLVAIADGTVANESPPDSVWKVGQFGLYVIRAGREQYPARPHFARDIAPCFFLDADGEAFLDPTQGRDGAL